MLVLRYFCVVFMAAISIAHSQETYSTSLTFEGHARNVASFEWVIAHSSPFYDSTGILLSGQNVDSNELMITHDYPFLTLWVRLHADDDWYNREVCLLDREIVVNVDSTASPVMEVSEGANTIVINDVEDKYGYNSNLHKATQYQAAVEGMYPGMLREIPIWKIPSLTQRYLNQFEQMQIELDSIISSTGSVEVQRRLLSHKAMINHYSLIPSDKLATAYVDSVGPYGEVGYSNLPLYLSLASTYDVNSQPDSLHRHILRTIEMVTEIRNPFMSRQLFGAINSALRYHRQWKPNFGSDLLIRLREKVREISDWSGIKYQALDTTPMLGNTQLHLGDSLLVRSHNGQQKALSIEGKWIVICFSSLTCPGSDFEHELANDFAKFAASNDSVEFVCLILHQYSEDFTQSSWHSFRPDVDQLVFGSDPDFDIIKEKCEFLATPTWIVLNPSGIVHPQSVSETEFRFRPVENFKNMLSQTGKE